MNTNFEKIKNDILMKYSRPKNFSEEKASKNPVDSEENNSFSSETFELMALKDKLKNYQETIDSLNKKVKLLQTRIDEKSTTIKQMSEELKKLYDSLEEKDFELDSLNEFVDQLQKEEELLFDVSDEDIEWLKSLKIVIVGGHETLQTNIASKFPNFKMIKSGQHTFDVNIIKNYDIVCFMSKYLDHATLYKAKRVAISSNKKYIYFSSKNLDIAIMEIIKALKD